MVELTNLFYGERVDGKILVDGSELTAIKKKLTYDDMVFYAGNYLASKGKNAPLQNAPGYDILADAYRRLLTEHIDHEKIDERALIQGAISGMADAAGDKYTTYFPPVAAQEFSDSLNGEFEGVGAYVDMAKPGELMITGPIPGSPAEKAGLLAGDRIIKIDTFEVTKDTALSDAIRKIKGPAGTQVKLTILRNGDTIEKQIERKKIKIDLVTYKKLDSQNSYIQITSFGAGTTEGFLKAVNTMTQDGTQRLILDLRNNGGGDLQEVSNLLDYFVPAGEAKIVVKGLTSTEKLFSTGQDSVLAGKKIIILINKGTASASEILAGTIQDYLPKTAKLVGETSFGKGSVQSLYPYWDGSTLKYTIAKWYTGKAERTIDHTGLTPDYEVELSIPLYQSGTDTQLDFAKTVNF
jgi:carboxyl-terminal processing protease